MMNKLIEMLIKDEEIQKIRKEWIELNVQPWWGFNYDEYNGLDDYKKQIRIELKKMKKEKGIVD